jgi:hypothetical protein
VELLEENRRPTRAKNTDLEKEEILREVKEDSRIGDRDSKEAT